MKESLIIYTNNSEKYIGRLLDSVLEQIDEETQELIIIDDLSEDNTVPIIVNKIGFNFENEKNYKFYINTTKTGKKNSIIKAKKIATGEFKFIINKKKRIKLGGKNDTNK